MSLVSRGIARGGGVARRGSSRGRTAAAAAAAVPPLLPCPRPAAARKLLSLVARESRRTSGCPWEREAAKELVVHASRRFRSSSSSSGSSSSSRRGGGGLDDGDDENDPGDVVPRPPAAWFQLERSLADAAIDAVGKVRGLLLQEQEEEEEGEREEVARRKCTGLAPDMDDGGGAANFDERKRAAAAAAARRVLFSCLDQEELLSSPEFPVEEAPPSPPLPSDAGASAAAAAATSSPPATPAVCSLAPAPAGRRFARRDLRAYVSGLFHSIPEARRKDRLPPVSLTRFDLFHVHFFLAGLEPLLLLEGKENRRREKRKEKKLSSASVSLGLLFHAAEYPALCPFEFPHDLGFCQRASDFRWSEQAAEWRTLIAARGSLASVRLGASSGSSSSVVADSLVWPELREMRTLLESDLGIWLGDGVLCVAGGGEEDGKEEGGRKQESKLREVLVYVPGLMF